MRVVIDAQSMDELMAKVDEYFEKDLGPAIARDAERYCPKDTGALAASIEHHLEGHTLIVSASGGAGGRDYALFVEMGHRIYHPSTGVSGPGVTEPRAFLRPALYQQRS